jgi:P27 family predicted phage terminase small subunit
LTETTDNSLPKPPEWLEAQGKAFWLKAVEQYTLLPFELELLKIACSALDRAETARGSMRNDGAYIIGQRGKLVAHPATRVLKEAEDSFRQIIGKLELQRVGR